MTIISFCRTGRPLTRHKKPLAVKVKPVITVATPETWRVFCWFVTSHIIDKTFSFVLFVFIKCFVNYNYPILDNIATQGNGDNMHWSSADVG